MTLWNPLNVFSGRAHRLRTDRLRLRPLAHRRPARPAPTARRSGSATRRSVGLRAPAIRAGTRSASRRRPSRTPSRGSARRSLPAPPRAAARERDVRRRRRTACRRRGRRPAAPRRLGRRVDPPSTSARPTPSRTLPERGDRSVLQARDQLPPQEDGRRKRPWPRRRRRRRRRERRDEPSTSSTAADEVTEPSPTSRRSRRSRSCAADEPDGARGRRRAEPRRRRGAEPATLVVDRGRQLADDRRRGGRAVLQARDQLPSQEAPPRLPRPPVVDARRATRPRATPRPSRAAGRDRA